MTFVCKDCGKKFNHNKIQGRWPKRCSSCRDKEKERFRASKEK